MNRKQRRPAAKHAGTRKGPLAAAPGTPAEHEQLLARGLIDHQAGRLAQAEACYRKILAADPGNVHALHRLGILAHQVGQVAAAVDLISQAIALNDRLPELHNNLGNALLDIGRPAEAEASYQRALALRPDYAAAHNNLGNALQARGELTQAEACYRQALAVLPDYVEAHNNLGITLLEQGQPVESEACYRRALRLKPDYAEACSNLGNALYVQGRPAEAEACCRRALALRPDYPAGLNNLGNALKDQGRLEEAEACHRRALALKPDFAEAHNNLGLAFKNQGRFADAEACFRRAIALKPASADAYCNLGNLQLDRSDIAGALDLAQKAIELRDAREAKVLFVRCISRFDQTGSSPAGSDLRDNLLRAFRELWGRPSELAAFTAAMLKQDDALAVSIRRANEAWPRHLTAPELLTPTDWAAMRQNQLLLCLLEATPVCDLELERFLTALRAVLLDAAVGVRDPAASEEAALDVCCALAQQCFINEYVFALSDGEIEQASRLRKGLIEGLESGGAVPALSLAALAAYVPLGSLPQVDAILRRPWPAALELLLVQQVREPLEDQNSRASIPRLTPVADEVSLLVQQQYEENPYPRWVSTASMLKPTTLDIYLRRQLPLARFRGVGKVNGLEILIAGCGTGQHSIETAQRLIGAQILAIDLSLTSLCYAQRKSRALGLNHLHYAQADILQLGSIGRSFDMIEAGGVLHHLAEPLAGWRILLSLLRPGGIMRVGLYSALARSDIVAAQAFIAERGYGGTADEIRRFRQDLMRSDSAVAARIASKCRDFFSTSECRDLLFHRQEHRFTLPQIQSFLAECGLTFLGLDVDGQVLRRFRERFPDAEALSDLGLWNAFELEHPRIFTGMYQFYVQKP